LTKGKTLPGESQEKRRKGENRRESGRQKTPEIRTTPDSVSRTKKNKIASGAKVRKKKLINPNRRKRRPKKFCQLYMGKG